MFKIEKLDHGVLSMPNRTKNIDSDLDKYKAEQEQLNKRKLDDVKFLNGCSQIEAKLIFAVLENKHFRYYAKRAGIKLSEAQIELKAMCVNPQKAIKVFNALIDVVKD